MLNSVFLLNAKKVRIFKIMSGGYAVKIQQCVKKNPAVFGNFQFLKIFAISQAKSATNCLMRGRQRKKVQVRTDAFLEQCNVSTQTSRGCDARAGYGDLKYGARHCHTFFVLQISSQAINLKINFFSLILPADFDLSQRALVASSFYNSVLIQDIIFRGRFEVNSVFS